MRAQSLKVHGDDDGGGGGDNHSYRGSDTGPRSLICNSKSKSQAFLRASAVFRGPSERVNSHFAADVGIGFMRG